MQADEIRLLGQLANLPGRQVDDDRVNHLELTDDLATELFHVLRRIDARLQHDDHSRAAHLRISLPLELPFELSLLLLLLLRPLRACSRDAVRCRQPDQTGDAHHLADPR